MDRKTKYDKSEANKTELSVTLTGSANEALEHIASENDVDSNFVFEKVAENIVNDKKFKKWQKTKKASGKSKDTASDEAQMH
ncbi:MAG: hypothetical protein D3913_16570 [Candidatus Electrothrix sp. LOE1_4_5]|nr:hypothetical protein [Candidatus Electrothrix gigas]